MANVSRPRGARPVGTIGGNSWQNHIRSYAVDASAANIFIGDWVIMEADGGVAPATAGATELLGVCVGVPYWMVAKTNGVSGHNNSTTSLDMMKKYHATGTAEQILVVTGPDIIYEMQEDAVGSALALADVGANVDLLATAGSTTTGASLQQLDSSTLTTGAAQFRLVAFVDRPDNELGVTGSPGASWLIKGNETHFAKLAGV